MELVCSEEQGTYVQLTRVCDFVDIYTPDRRAVRVYLTDIHYKPDLPESAPDYMHEAYARMGPETVLAVHCLCGTRASFVGVPSGPMGAEVVHVHLVADPMGLPPTPGAWQCGCLDQAETSADITWVRLPNGDLRREVRSHDAVDGAVPGVPDWPGVGHPCGRHAG